MNDKCTAHSAGDVKGKVVWAGLILSLHVHCKYYDPTPCTLEVLCCSLWANLVLINFFMHALEEVTPQIINCIWGYSVRWGRHTDSVHTPM